MTSTPAGTAGLGSAGDRSSLARLVEAVGGADGTAALALLETHEDMLGTSSTVPRRVVAHALNVLLFADLLGRVPSAAAYVGVQIAGGRPIMLDHGAVRTIAWSNTGALPPGIEQVTRILEPLGFQRAATYPLGRIHMTGYSYRHRDLPEFIGQWFVSELHPDEFSVPVQHAVDRVFSTSVDPLDAGAQSLLARLADDREVTIEEASVLLRALVTCFARLHAMPTIDDYELLLGESAELAWIATEGTAFNHATDRVSDIEATVAAERLIGRPIKDAVEVSASGRIRQTAHRATMVWRSMRTDEGAIVDRRVPGSFFEFIERRRLDAGEPSPGTPVESGVVGALDLGFDASNAQGIFAMTRVQEVTP